MTAVDYAGIEVKKNELIRKGTQGSVFIAPVTATAITSTNLFDATTGGLAALPAGYKDLGWTAITGAVFARKVTSTDIPAWGTNDPVRSDITADTTTLQVDGYETKLQTISLYTGVDQSTMIPATNGSLQVNLPSAPQPKFYRALALAIDESSGGEIVIARFLPRCQVTNYTNQSYSNDKDPLVWGIELTAYQDSTLGFAQAQLYGGEGWLSLITRMGFPRIVTCTTAVSTALVATSGTFSSADVGATVSGGTIPANTTIATFTDSTHVVMSAAATAIATAVPVTVTPV